MKIGQRIKSRRIELGMSADDLANKLGKNRSTIYRYESGDIENMPIDILEPIAEVLDVTPAYLMGWTNEENGITHPDLRPIRSYSVPLIGEIACGQPIYAEEPFHTSVDVDAQYDVDCCLTARGDSMINARINDGDHVFIKKTPVVENGEIAAVIINDEMTLKRLYFYREQALLILRSENPAYKDMVFSGEELEGVHVFGKAVFCQSMLV